MEHTHIEFFSSKMFSALALFSAIQRLATNRYLKMDHWLNYVLISIVSIPLALSLFLRLIPPLFLGIDFDSLKVNLMQRIRCQLLR